MTKRERVEAVLRGGRPDHAPVSFWHHFPPTKIHGRAAVDAHLTHFRTYDLDFLKVMDDHQYPRGQVEVVRSVRDLRNLSIISVDQPEFADQLDILRQLRRELGDVLMCTTMFNPWATLRRLVAPPDDRHGPPRLEGATDVRDQMITDLLRQDRSSVSAALMIIAETLARFSQACVEAGASGIFLSVRDDWVDTPANGAGTYDEMVRPADVRILSEVSKASFNWVHVCGRPQDFDRFGRYPVAVINWADRAAGPSITYACQHTSVAIAGGVDNLGSLPHGSPADVAAEVRDALRQAGSRPMLITPGCTYDPLAVPEANLRAMVAAARGAPT